MNTWGQNLKITLVLIAFAVVVMLLSFFCEKKCSGGEVKFQGKCYVPGVPYNNAGERVL